MDYIFAGLLVWLIVAFPFLLIARGIFLFSENSKFKYQSIYIKAAISTGIGLLILIIFYSFPTAVSKVESKIKTAHIGTYSSSDGKKTISIFNTGAIYLENSDNPGKNIQAQYTLFRDPGKYQYKKEDVMSEFTAGAKLYFSGASVSMEDYILRVTSYYSGKNKKPIDSSFFFTLRSDTLTLVPVKNTSITEKYIKKPY